MLTAIRADKSICGSDHFLFTIRKLKSAMMRNIKNQRNPLQSNCEPLINLVHSGLLSALKIERSNLLTV